MTRVESGIATVREGGRLVVDDAVLREQSECGCMVNERRDQNSADASPLSPFMVVTSLISSRTQIKKIEFLSPPF